MTQGLQELLLGRAPDVAPRLLGAVFVCALPGGTVAVRLTELEAYGGPHDSDLPDPGAHTYRGRTARNASMFEAPGRIYVYFTYGLHHAVNFVCRGEGTGGGILVRSGEVVLGEDVALRRRLANRSSEPPFVALAAARATWRRHSVSRGRTTAPRWSTSVVPTTPWRSRSRPCSARPARRGRDSRCGRKRWATSS